MVNRGHYKLIMSTKPRFHGHYILYYLLERLIFFIQLLLHDVACAAVHINPLTI